MLISIEFLGMQRTITGSSTLDMPITDKTTVNDALEYVRHLYPDLHLKEETILVTVNNEIAPLEQPLNANDSISFLPFIGGG
jgi:molybdopterin converting factor small subunit